MLGGYQIIELKTKLIISVGKETEIINEEDLKLLKEIANSFVKNDYCKPIIFKGECVDENKEHYLDFCAVMNIRKMIVDDYLLLVFNSFDNVMDYSLLVQFSEGQIISCRYEIREL